MTLDPESLRVGRGRITQVFRYLEALNQRRNPVKRLIGEQPWRLWLQELPDHKSISKGILIEAQTDDDSSFDNADIQEFQEGFILKVRRPEITYTLAPPH